MLIIVVYYCLEEHWYLGIANYEIYSEDKSITCRIQGKDTLIYLINQAPGPYWENLDSTDRAQRGPYKKDQGPIFSQDGPEQAWLIRHLLHDCNCLEEKPK